MLVKVTVITRVMLVSHCAITVTVKSLELNNSAAPFPPPRLLITKPDTWIRTLPQGRCGDDHHDACDSPALLPANA